MGMSELVTEWTADDRFRMADPHARQTCWIEADTTLPIAP
jgi:hypothetical protein